MSIGCMKYNLMNQIINDFLLLGSNNLLTLLSFCKNTHIFNETNIFLPLNLI
jgi:hypothetical protein